ncbi:MAG: 50S ribosomal protein L18, partial [Patescibacteria group bacterium]
MHNINKKRRIIGTKERPRLSVFRSNKYLYAQIFDDETGITIAGITEKNITSGKTRIDRAHELGMLIAKKALEKKLNKVVFDR